MTPTPMTAPAVLDREFLEIRAKILQLAASFDRMDRGESSVSSDPRMALIDEGLQILQQPGGNRAEKIQMIFSREYEENWRDAYGI